MSKELVISATPHETRVAIVEDGQLCEIYIEREKEFALVGSLYKGRVTRVLPGMQSAFVDIGLDSDAFLYVSDFLEHLEDYDHVAARRAQSPAAAAAERRSVCSVTTNGGVFLRPSHLEPSDGGLDMSTCRARRMRSCRGCVCHHAARRRSLQVAAAGTSCHRSSPRLPRPCSTHSGPIRAKRPNRGRGGFNDRGGRADAIAAGDARAGRGGRDRRPGRDLPPSKYASPRPFDSRPRESQPYEPPPRDFVPIILPGESLAKYKDRIPAAPAAPPAGASAVGTPTARQRRPCVCADSRDEELSAGLPGSLYADSVSRIHDARNLRGSETAAAPSAEDVRNRCRSLLRDSRTEPRNRIASRRPNPKLPEASGSPSPQRRKPFRRRSSALAEQLAEAKHEEAQAEAEERAEAEEAVAEPFVEAAELEELQEALNTIRKIE